MREPSGKQAGTGSIETLYRYAIDLWADAKLYGQTTKCAVNLKVDKGMMVYRFVPTMDLPEFGPDDDITVEEIEHEAPATNSSFARRVALQVLYEMDATNHRPGEIMTARLEAQDTDRRETRYVRRLVQGFVANRTAIDDVIRPFVQGWPLEQIASIDRNILRLAVMELIEQRVSISVVIDEAVGLANIFGTENSLGFINGVLGQLVADDRVLETLRTLKTDGDAL